jgi:hypothetical protein
MKTTFRVLVALAFVFSFTSCEKELGNIDFNTSINKTIAVHVDQTTGDPITFSTDELMSLDNEDTHDYLSKIQDISINSLSYQLMNFSGDDTGLATLTFMIDGFSLKTHTNVNVKSVVEASVVNTITDTDFLNQIATALKNNQQVTAKYVGGFLCDNDAMDFDVKVIIDVAVTANVLD